MVVARVEGWGVRKMGKGGQMYKLPVLKKSWGCNVQHGNYS